MTLHFDRDRTFLRLTRRPPYETGDGRFVVVDLFSGCGGMTLGMAHAAHEAGHRTHVALAVDFDTVAIDVFKANFPQATCLVRDVGELFDGELGTEVTKSEACTRQIVGGQVDVLLGGPPCQGHSNLNNHTRRQDPRNQLYTRMIRAAEVLEPRLVAAENVPAVLHDRNQVVKVSKQALQRHGYKVADGVLDFGRLGVPQRRRRHLLLASLDDEFDPVDMLHRLEQATPDEKRSVRWAIEDLANAAPHQEFDRPSAASAENQARIAWLFDNDKYDLPDQLRPACHRNQAHTYKSIYGRMRWDEPAQTVTTGFGSMGQGRYVHPSQPRTITPHEAARLQGFPDFFSFEATQKRTAWGRLIGNAVPPLVTMRIGELFFREARPTLKDSLAISYRI